MAIPAMNFDLHGNVPETAPVALLLIDVLNDLSFEGGDRLRPHALRMVDRVVALKRRAREAGVPVIYANDNFGRWRSSVETLVAHCLEADSRGRALAERLKPDADDYVVLKPKHSAFYGTTLDVLLNYLGAHTLVLTGIAGDSCVLFTANDAFMRDFRIVVPPDCTASQDAEDNAHAISLMAKVLHAETPMSAEVDFESLARRARTLVPSLESEAPFR